MRMALALALVFVWGCRPATTEPEKPSPRVDSGVSDATGTTDTPRPTDSSDSAEDTDSADTAAPVDTAGPGVCGPSNWSSADYTMDRGGIERQFRVHVPASYDPAVPAPLILAFHGWGGNASEFLGSSAVTDEADARGYVVVAPVGLGSGNPDRSWNSWSFRGSTTGIGGDGQAICDDAATTDYAYDSCDGIADNGCSWTHCQDDDVDFVRELVALTSENLCIDPERVFAVGGSNGGMFSWELGQNEATAGLFRAIAPLIGLPHRAYLDPPATDGGMPVMVITGMSDRTVPPGDWEDPSPTTTTDGDVYYYTGATGIVRSWSEAAGCAVASPAAVADVGVSEVECRSYCPHDETWSAVLDCRADMGHSYQLRWAWPLIMDFFDQQSGG